MIMLNVEVKILVMKFFKLKFLKIIDNVPKLFFAPLNHNFFVEGYKYFIEFRFAKNDKMMRMIKFLLFGYI